jgi:hypothetical protein
LRNSDRNRSTDLPFGLADREAEHAQIRSDVDDFHPAIVCGDGPAGHACSPQADADGVSAG